MISTTVVPSQQKLLLIYDLQNCINKNRPRNLRKFNKSFTKKIFVFNRSKPTVTYIPVFTYIISWSRALDEHTTILYALLPILILSSLFNQAVFSLEIYCILYVFSSSPHLLHDYIY
jgi:hypothetical protein